MLSVKLQTPLTPLSTVPVLFLVAHFRACGAQDIYAKSREQKMLEANEEMEYQEALEKERERQALLEGGFGNAGDGDDGDDDDAFQPGFQSSSLPAHHSLSARPRVERLSCP